MCLKMFYFDDKIYAFEKNAAFNDCLRYLENLFQKTGASNVLNSLIGFSWYYLIEGPLDSGRYEKEDTSFALSTWKQYIDKVIDSDVYDSFTLYICAYTLSLNISWTVLRKNWVVAHEKSGGQMRGRKSVGADQCVFNLGTAEKV